MSTLARRGVLLVAVILLLALALSIGSTGDVETSFGAVGFLLLAGLAAIASAFALFCVIVGVHELGHYVAGAAVGFQFYAVQVGVWRLARYTRGYRLFTAPHDYHASGFVMMIPRQLDGFLPRFRWFVLGGPIASLLLAVASFLVWMNVNVTDSSGLATRAISVAAGLASFPAAMSLVWGLLPVKHRKGTSSDFELLKLSFRDPEKLKRSVAGWMVIVPWRHGVRAANWSSEAIEFLQRGPLPEEGWEPWLSLTAYYHALDQSRTGDAAKLIRQALERCPSEEGPTRCEVYGEAAYSRAFLEGNLDEARQLLDDVQPKTDDMYHTYQRAEVAILALEGRMIEARERAYEVFELLLQSARERVEDNIQFDIDRLQEIIGEPLYVRQTAG